MTTPEADLSEDLAQTPGGQANRRRVLIGTGIGAGLLALAVYRIGLARLADAIGGLAYGWLFAAVAIKLTAVTIKGFRWGYILGATLDDSPKAYIRGTFIGYFGNAVLIFKLGELMRLRVAKGHNDASYAQILGTMIFERAMDGILLLVLLVLCVAMLPVPQWAEQGLLPVAILMGVFVVGLIVLAVFDAQVPRFLLPTKVGAWIHGRINSVLTNLGSGLRAARSAKALFITLIFTLVAWSVEVAGTFMVLQAVGGDLGLGAALVVTVIVSVGLAVPAGPPGLGPHQWFYVLLLTPYGVAESDAVALSLGITGFMLSSLTLIGLPLALREGVFWRR